MPEDFLFKPLSAIDAYDIDNIVLLWRRSNFLGLLLKNRK